MGAKPTKLPKFILPMMLMILAAQAASIGGKWAGVIVIDDDGTKIETPVELHLEQKNGVLTGKIGRENDPELVEIRNAKIEGDALTFEASSVETSSSMRFSLKVQGEKMQGEMKGTLDGNDLTAKVSFSHVR